MKNKKRLSIALVIILIFGIAPYFMGNMAKENIEKHAAQTSQIPGYILEIRDYDQGWFTSRATLSYGFDGHTLNSMKNSENLDQDFFEMLSEGLIFDVTVFHGPVTFQNGVNFASLTLSGKIQDIDHQAYRDFMAKANIDSLASIFVSVSYGGTTSITVESAPFSVDYSEISGKRVTVDSAGIEMQATINAALDEYAIKARMDKLAMTFEEGSIVFDQMTIQSNGNKINDFLWAGNGTTFIGKFNITAPDTGSFSLTDFTGHYDLSKESDTALALGFTLNMANITADKVILNDIHLDLDLNHLDLDALTYYVKFMKESYRPRNGEIPTPEQTAANIQSLTPHVGQRLIQGSPELVINKFNFLMADGFYKSNGTLSIDGDDLDTIDQLSDPTALNQRLAANVNIKFNKALAEALTAIGLKKQLAAGSVNINSIPSEQLDQMIAVQSSVALQAFITQGYIQLDGEEYSVHFDMKNGQRLINGKPLPIPGL